MQPLTNTPPTTPKAPDPTPAPQPAATVPVGSKVTIRPSGPIDAVGATLKQGDQVLIPAQITQLYGGTTGRDVQVKVLNPNKQGVSVPVFNIPMVLVVKGTVPTPAPAPTTVRKIAVTAGETVELVETPPAAPVEAEAPAAPTPPTPAPTTTAKGK